MVALTEKLNLMALKEAWGDAPGFNNTPRWGFSPKGAVLI